MKIEVIDVHYSYPDGTPALQGVSLELRSGEVVSLLGPNGSGKSTLLLILAGLIEPLSGEVLLNGERISSLGTRYRKMCGILFQDPADQLLAPTVEEDVSIGPRQLDLPEEEIKDRVESVLLRLGIIDIRGKSPYKISYGQAAKVALAGLLAQDPDIYLLDEPSSSLDLYGVSFLIELIQELRDQGKIIVVASQDSELVAEISDRVYLLDRGRVISAGKPNRVLTDIEMLTSIGIRSPTTVRIFSKVFPNAKEIPVREEDLIRKIRDFLYLVLENR